MPFALKVKTDVTFFLFSGNHGDVQILAKTSLHLQLIPFAALLALFVYWETYICRFPYSLILSFISLSPIVLRVQPLTPHLFSFDLLYSPKPSVEYAKTLEHPVLILFSFNASFKHKSNCSKEMYSKPFG